MINWTTVKALKQEAWQTQSEEDWKKWKEEKFKPFYDQAKEAMTDKENETIMKEIGEIHEKKKTWWSKGKKNFTPSTKTSYIFREDEGAAWIRLCDALANYLKNNTPNKRIND